MRVAITPASWRELRDLGLTLLTLFVGAFLIGFSAFALMCGLAAYSGSYALWIPIAGFVLAAMAGMCVGAWAQARHGREAG